MLLAAFPAIHALPPHRSVFTRDNTCSAAGLKSCANFPDNFCCKSTEDCLSLAGGTTALCCPQGHDCSKIEPIVCDLSNQDPKEGLTAPVKTTVLDVKLPACGDSCCPFGYTCNDQKKCEIDADQSIAPATPKDDNPSGSATTTAGKGLSSATSSAEATTTAGADPSKKATDEQKPPKPFPTAQVVAGVISGVIALILLVGTIMCYKARKNKSNASNASTESWGNKIVVSQPMVDERTGSMGRTDFLLKRPDSSSTGTTRVERLSNVQRPTSMDMAEHRQQHRTAGPLSTPGSASEARFEGQNSVAIPPIRGLNSSSVNIQKPRLHRGPSEESIQIRLETHNSDRRNTAMTEFSDLVQATDLPPVHKGYRFLDDTPPRR